MTAPALPAPESLHVLMIGLNDAILTGQGAGDVRERHLDYASRIGSLHMIMYSPRGHNLSEMAFSDKLTVTPTRSLSRLTFVWDVVRIGRRICRDHPINVITTQDPFTTGLAGLILKRRTGIPLDVQNHSDFFDNAEWIAERPLLNGLFNLLGKWVSRRADTHRVLTETERAKYPTFGVETDRVVVLSTPTRLGRFTPDAPPGEQNALRSHLRLPPNAPVLLWVGRPVAFKRVNLLLEAFTRVLDVFPDAFLVLVGDFSERPDLREQAVQPALAGRVRFAGAVDHADLPTYYRLCNIYVHSSVYEGLGKVMIEAAASGRPVVSTRTAGGQEIVADGETGLLANPEDPADLSAKIEVLLGDPARAAKLGQAGRTQVLDQFDHARNLDAIIETWQRTASYWERA
jgi:glycosyltransferase involved in cell wall biosynthesis